MTTSLPSRSILLALGLGFSLAVACFDDSVLENEECIDNKDCGNSQECVITDYQFNVTVSGYGWCRPKGSGCLVGQQPGCRCSVDTQTYKCDAGFYSTPPLCPTAQTDSCTCEFPEDMSANCPSG